VSNDAASDRLMSIGAFGSRSGLSMRALRLYDEQGVLNPDHVDPDNGYRWYRESQLYAARLIVLLRHLDMPLPDVARFVAASPDEAAERLDTYWERIENRFSGQRRLVELLRTSIAGGDPGPGDFDIVERDVPEQVVLAERRHLHLSEMEEWLRKTKARLTDAADAASSRSGRLFVIFHGEVSQDSDGPIEVCVPIRGMSPGARVEPAHHEVFLTVTKAQFDMPQILSAYDAIERWLDASGRVAVGAPREIYFDGIDPHTADPVQRVCEIARPVRRAH
jgi:DNA-binding transcriptional MerR regulator